MRLYRFLLFFFSYHQCAFITVAYSTDSYHYLNQTISSINIIFYQCDTNKSVFNNITTTIDAILYNLMTTCNISCCDSYSFNKSRICIRSMLKISFCFFSLGFAKTCQVTVQSRKNICLGHLCYSDDCSNVALLTDTTHHFIIKNKTTTASEIHSSHTHLSLSSLVNVIKTKWASWIDKIGLTIRHTVLIILFIINISLTLMALVVVLKSVRHANIVADRKSYRYTLL